MDGERITILVCDDNDAGRYTKVRPLKHAGFEVLEAATGGDALRVMAEHRPPLAVMDVKLPDMSGLEVTAVIKREYPGTFVLQTSACFVTLEDRVRGLEEGADSYLIQPMEPRELVAGVRALLRIREVEGELRTSRAAQRESEHRYRRILESATDFAIITTDLDGCVTTWNSGARNILGWEEAEIVGQDLRQIWTPEDRVAGADQAEIATARRLGRAEDQRWHLRKDGERFWANGLLMTLNDDVGGVIGYLKILRDQTQQRQADAFARSAQAEREAAEEKLRASEAQFRTLANSIPQLAWMADREGWIFWYNERWYGYTATRPEDMKGWGWQSVHDPEVLPQVMERWTRSIASGEAFEMTFPLRGADGVFRPFLTLVVPVRDDAGEVVRWIGTNTDVSEQQRAAEELERRVAERTAALTAANTRLREEIAERERVQEALRQAQKMEAVGQLTGGIAHDFNNLLMGISGSLQIIQQRLATGQTRDIGKYASAALTASARAAALTQRLLAFARRQPLDPKPIKVNSLIVSMEDLLRRTLGEQITLEVVLAGGLWTTLCDAHQLENALLNLAINARDAMPEGGRLTIETANTYLDDPYAAAQGDLEPGQYVALCVTDTGTGMPADVLEKAFDPFFTTKPIGQGTGLGLSMLYGFIKQSGGHVRIYSEVDQGTTVKLYLPRHRGAAAQADDTAAPESPRAQTGETVLVVEDEPLVRMLALDVLADLGYASLQADDGPSALQLLESQNRIDLLVTDVGLPGLNGRQLADRARELRPELKVLFITGYAHNAAIGNGLLEPGMEMLGKPFALEALAQKISGMLHGG